MPLITNPNAEPEKNYTNPNQRHAVRAGTAWPVHLLKSLPPETFKEASKNKSENNFESTIYFNKSLGNTVAPAQRTLVLEHAYLLYDKYTVPREEVSKRMNVLLIQNSFMLLTCPELLHVTVNKELERLSGLYSTLPTVDDVSCQPQYGRLE